MGDYIYALRSPKHARNIMVSLDDTCKQINIYAGSMSYLYKPNYSYDGFRFNMRYSIVIEKLKKLWEGKALPQYVVFTRNENNHKICIGGHVYKLARFPDIEYNDGSGDLIHIGHVKEIYNA